MKHLAFITAAIAAMASLAACSTGSASADNDLRDAEAALAQGDMTVAQSVADHIIGSKNLSGLTPRQLGRLSIIYMQLADSAEQADNIASATDCYLRAFDADPDSAAAFYSTVPPEHTPHAMMLSSIVKNLTTPDTIPADDPDTIPAEDPDPDYHDQGAHR